MSNGKRNQLQKLYYTNKDGQNIDLVSVVGKDMELKFNKIMLLFFKASRNRFFKNNQRLND